MSARIPAVELPTLNAHIIEAAARRALEEDLGELGDATSEAAISPETRLRAAIRTRKPGRVAGVDVARAVFALADEDIIFEVEAPDGCDVAALDTIAVVDGPAIAVLAAERSALNFIGRLCGVATLTRSYVEAVDATMARITGTRKTTPGLRALERHAIRAGGGVPHRFGLGDAILIKDNHIAAAGGVDAALMAVRARAGHMVHVSVEVDSLDQLAVALRYSPDVVLLDNFSLDDMGKAVRLVGGRCTVEASGGVSLDTVRAIAETGVDVISVGALTHSAPALDVGLDAID